MRVSFSKKPTGRTKDEVHFHALVTAYVHTDGPEVHKDDPEVDTDGRYGHSEGAARDGHREKRTCVREARMPVSEQPVEAYFDQVISQVLASDYSKAFNEALNSAGVDSSGPVVNVAEMHVLKLPERGGQLVLLSDTVHRGERARCLVGQTLPERERAAAFMHFSYEASEHRLVVGSIRHLGDSYYSAPIIHTVDQKGFGTKNLGTFGIDDFRIHHRYTHATCIYAYIDTCICIYIYTHIHTHIHVYIHISIQIYTDIYVNTHTHTHTHTHTDAGRRARHWGCQSSTSLGGR